MRITGGSLRGRTVLAPSRGARPTTDRTREALFNLLQARIDLHEVVVLDVFAGSGALGFEALSRGAEQVTFVEKGREALSAIRANVTALRVEDATLVIRGDAYKHLVRTPDQQYDLVLADPPYEDEGITRLPALVLPWLRPGGFFALEHDARNDFADHPQLDTSRTYGNTVVSLFEAL